MLVVPELDDPFLPLPDELLVNLSESKAVVEALLDALPAGYSSNTSDACALGPALQVCLAQVLCNLMIGSVGACRLGQHRTLAHCSLASYT